MMKIKLNVWRQDGPKDQGRFEHHEVDCTEDMSFLEMFDTLNERLISESKSPIAFDHDCREGICGMCSMVIDGLPHGPQKATTTCQLHMRQFSDGDEITVEPFRARAFKVLKDLVVDRSPLDRVQQAGGYVSVGTGAPPDANALPIGKTVADEAFDYAACIGCGACVAACPNASAMLFSSAKVAHLALLPQGRVERTTRVTRMVQAMENEGFGGCTNHGECEASCPKEISVDAIAMLNREVMAANLSSR
jgi:succinate dehydrogenase / fumarate reductase iron-sulfur subunit